MSHPSPSLFETNGKREAIPASGTVIKPQLPQALTPGWQAEKQYYTIGEVAALFGLRTSNIRFWTTEFKLKVRTNRKGDRMYTPAHIQTLRAIYYLVKEKGFTLSGAKAKLREGSHREIHTAVQEPETHPAANKEVVSVAAQARPIIYTLELQQSLLQLRNRLVNLRNHLT